MSSQTVSSSGNPAPLVTKPIEALAIAIFYFEGGNRIDPTVRNIRNLNPGNLRPYTAGQATDGSNYRVFDSWVEGWNALVADLDHKLRVHLKGTDTLLDLFNIYAPGEDHNNPKGYAQFVCGFVTNALGRPITLSTHIVDLLSANQPKQ